MRHTRLLAALLKAAAFSRSKQQAPLHSDPSMLSLLPERMGLNRLAVNRRISLDNSALDRRRWEAAAAAVVAANAGAAGSGSPREPAPVRSSAPLATGGAQGASRGEQPVGLPTLQLSSQQQRSAEGRAGGAGGWQPQLSAIHSDDSGGESSQRSSLDASGAGLATAAGLPTIHEQSQAAMPGSPFAAAAQRPPTPEPPAAGSRPLRILVAEDNKINQLVIGKVLQVRPRCCTLALHVKRCASDCPAGVAKGGGSRRRCPCTPAPAACKHHAKHLERHLAAPLPPTRRSASCPARRSRLWATARWRWRPRWRAAPTSC